MQKLVQCTGPHPTTLISQASAATLILCLFVFCLCLSTIVMRDINFLIFRKRNDDIQHNSILCCRNRFHLRMDTTLATNCHEKMCFFFFLKMCLVFFFYPVVGFDFTFWGKAGLSKTSLVSAVTSQFSCIQRDPFGSSLVQDPPWLKSVNQVLLFLQFRGRILCCREICSISGANKPKA